MTTASVTKLSQAKDVRKEIIVDVGDLSDFTVMNGKILLGIYIAPEKTRGGIIIPGTSKIEDVWQGTLGLVLKKGPLAFVDDETHKFHGQMVEVGDWVLFSPGDTRRLQVRGVNCRLIDDVHIQAKISDPEIITHGSV